MVVNTWFVTVKNRTNSREPTLDNQVKRPGFCSAHNFKERLTDTQSRGMTEPLVRCQHSCGTQITEYPNCIKSGITGNAGVQTLYQTYHKTCGCNGGKDSYCLFCVIT
jgi:hypothetical protein